MLIYIEYSEKIQKLLIYVKDNTYLLESEEKLVLKLQKALTTNSQLIIADLSGRVVLHQQLANGQRNIDLTVSHLPAGRYFIKISNYSELINQSFVIIK